MEGVILSITASLAIQGSFRKEHGYYSNSTSDFSSHWKNDYNCSSWYRYAQADEYLIVNCCELGEPSSKPSRMYIMKDYYELTNLEVKTSGYN